MFIEKILNFKNYQKQTHFKTEIIIVEELKWVLLNKIILNNNIIKLGEQILRFVKCIYFKCILLKLYKRF